MSLSSIEGYTVGADVDVVYQDFYDLGRIFQVEDRAEEIVSAMKEQIAAVEEAVAGAGEGLCLRHGPGGGRLHLRG